MDKSLGVQLTSLKEEFKELKREILIIYREIQWAHSRGKDITGYLHIQADNIVRARNILKEYCSLI